MSQHFDHPVDPMQRDGAARDTAGPTQSTQPVAPSGPPASDPARRVDASRPGLSRRGFIQSMGLSGAAAAVGHGAQLAAAAARETIDAASAPAELGPDPSVMRLDVNGRVVEVSAAPSDTLLHTLRTELDLTGPKEICDRAACGGCSVLVDGRVVAACMMLTVDAIGRRVTTIEGLADGERLHPIQEAFIRHDALQCGFCTPGLVVASKALLDEHAQPTMAQIRRGLAGNLCRCGTYTNVFNAVLDASGQAVPTDGVADGFDREATR